MCKTRYIVSVRHAVYISVYTVQSGTYTVHDKRPYTFQRALVWIPAGGFWEMQRSFSTFKDLKDRHKRREIFQNFSGSSIFQPVIIE